MAWRSSWVHNVSPPALLPTTLLVSWAAEEVLLLTVCFTLVQLSIVQFKLEWCLLMYGLGSGSLEEMIGEEVRGEWLVLAWSILSLVHNTIAAHVDLAFHLVVNSVLLLFFFALVGGFMIMTYICIYSILINILQVRDYYKCHSKTL